MSTQMTISKVGMALIQRFEGFRADAARLPDGRWVVGHGHVRSSPPATPFNAADAERALGEDLAPVIALLNETLLAPVSQNQFDALASFAFSVGPAAFRTSDVLRRFNAGEPIAAACAMDAWRKSGAMGAPQVIDLLVRRRAAEKALFLDFEGPTSAPSAFLKPYIDHAQAILSAAPIVRAPDLDAPEPTAALMEAAPDETADMLVSILESEPATAALLDPRRPVAAMDDVLDLVEVAPPALPTAARMESDPKEARAFVLLAVAGVAMILIGAFALFGGSDGAQTAFLALAAPGVLVTAMAGYYLAKGQSGRFGGRRLQGAALAG